jgi:hypothetical protein
MALINPNTSAGVNNQPAPASSDVIGFNNNGVTQQVSPSSQGTALPTQDQALQAAQTSDNAISVNIVGDPNGDFAGVNLLEQVMRDDTGLAVNTRVLNQPKVDINNAAIPSDAPAPINLYLAANVPQIIDTAGYQTVMVQGTIGSSIIVTTSNDGISFTTSYGASIGNTGSSFTSVAGLSLTAFPVGGRYMRFITSVQTSAIIYLRQTPFSSYAINGITSVSGTLGIQGVTYPNNNQLIGVDPFGNLRVAGPLSQGYQIGAYNVTYNGGYTGYTSTVTNNVVTAAQTAGVGGVIMAGVDQSLASKRIQTDNAGVLLVRGAPSTPATQSIEELLTQILGTLRVLTHYTYEAQLRDGFRSTADEPDIMLADYLNQASTLNNMTN